MSDPKTIRESIKAFLIACAVKPLAELYSEAMECQVSIDQTKGVPETSDNGTLFVDRSGNKFWPIRIPKNAKGTPHWRDYEGFPLDQFADRIGMTGWDFENRCSRWVVGDFDHRTNEAHTESGISADELLRVREKLNSVPWVQIQRSTSGGEGLHVYVFFDTPIPTANHTEHADLARYVFGLLSKECDYPFADDADVMGGNFWVWSKNQNEHSFELLKERTGSPVIPDNWRDSLPPRAAREVTPVTAGAGHHKLVDWLIANGYTAVYDPDENRLRTHTAALKAAHETLGLPGIFETVAKGRNNGDHNCFAYPRPNGSWYVVRYGENVTEHESWHKTQSGLTACVLTFRMGWKEATRELRLQERRGAYHVSNFETLAKLMRLVGLDFNLPDVQSRAAKVKWQSNGVVSIEMGHLAADPDAIEAWERLTTKTWGFSVGELAEMEKTFDDNSAQDIRYVRRPGNEKVQWYRRKDDEWFVSPKDDLRSLLVGRGVEFPESIIGQLEETPWVMVNLPMQTEYPVPGQFVWNKNAVQWAVASASEYDPSKHPYHTSIIEHVGNAFDDGCERDEWCERHGVRGADYLTLWLVLMLTDPFQPLPYLFLWCEAQQQGCKTSFFDMIRLLITDSGYCRVDRALQNEQGFNGEMANAIFGVVEETDFSTARNKGAIYGRIKDWTGRTLSIHPKHGTPYVQKNTMHMAQAGNGPKCCPIFDGDRRVSMGEVPLLDEEKKIAWALLEAELRKEAPYFRRTVEEMGKRLPPGVGGYYLPVLETQSKLDEQEDNRRPLTTAELALFQAIQEHPEAFAELQQHKGITETAKSLGYHPVPEGPYVMRDAMTLLARRLNSIGIEVVHPKERYARWAVRRVPATVVEIAKPSLVAFDCLCVDQTLEVFEYLSGEVFTPPDPKAIASLAAVYVQAA